MPPPLTLTRRTPLDDYVDVVRERMAFRNSNRSFVGTSVTPLECARLSTARRLDDATRFALMMDEPDYVIFSNDIPVAWHSTVRGIDSKALPPNPERWEWVIRKDTSIIYTPHFRIASHIVNTLNKELDNVHS